MENTLIILKFPELVCIHVLMYMLCVYYLLTYTVA